MVADLSSTTTTPKSKVLSRPPPPAKPKRAPLLPSGSDNNGRSLQRRPKCKDVTSRYLSSIPSSKANADKTSSSNSVSTPKKISPSPVSNRRDQTAEMSASAKILTKMSARSLSVSFQGESFALPVSKVGKPVNKGLRNGTPERKKSPATPGKKFDDSQQIYKQIWSRRSTHASFMTMSVDFANEKKKLTGSETASAVRALRNSKPELINLETLCDSDNPDRVISDSESISSGSTVGNDRGGPRAIVVPARFWQETINLLRRVQPVPVSQQLSRNNRPISGCKVLRDGPKLPPRGSSIAPAPMNSGAGCDSNLGNTPSILSFSADSKRGKVGEKKLLDAHDLRLLHNKHLQWRFANAKVDAAMVVQRAAAQKSLYNAWVTISKLLHSIISKRMQMQQLKQNLKLHSLLKKQMLYLDHWDLTDRDHSISLAGAIMVLESSSLCLPVLYDAKVDILNLKDAICSAVDVMQAMAVSICSLATKVENVNLMASELANAMKNERSLLDQCKDLLSTLTLLEMEDFSLRAHTLQLMPAATMTQW